MRSPAYACRPSFNTQPPEGGCVCGLPVRRVGVFQHTAARRRLQDAKFDDKNDDVFQHTAARRRLLLLQHKVATGSDVSTHSRPKAAAFCTEGVVLQVKVSTHSRPKAAAYAPQLAKRQQFGFNTQPPEGGCRYICMIWGMYQVSTHSRPKAAAAAICRTQAQDVVSTHSRPKAAACNRRWAWWARFCFNTQPPEGGCRASLCGLFRH